MMRASAVSVLLAATVVLIAPAAAASPDPRKVEAASRFERGLRLFDERDYSGAVAELTRAYELLPNATVLYDIGAVYAAMGRPVDATHALTEAIANPGTMGAEQLARAKQILSEQAAMVGHLAVTSPVQGAHVEVDGLDVGVTPLANPVDVAVGTHVVAVYAAGHTPLRRELTVSARATASASFELVPMDGRLGHVRVQSKLRGARLFANDQAIATTPIQSSVTLAPGKYHLELRRDGYATARTDVTIGEGAEAEVVLDPVEDPSQATPRGNLLVEPSEDESALSVDGIIRGIAHAPLALPAGPHHLRVEKAGFLASERDADVVSGETRVVRVYLAPTLETREALGRSVSTRRTIGWTLVGVGLPVAVAGGVVSYLGVGALSDANTYYNTVAASETSPTGSCNPRNGTASQMVEGTTCAAAESAAPGKKTNAQTELGVGIAGAAVGAAAVVTGLVLILTSDDPHKYDTAPASASAAPAFRFGVAPGGVSVSGTF